MASAAYFARHHKAKEFQLRDGSANVINFL